MSTEKLFPSQEQALIASLEELAGPSNPKHWKLGIGDDCAIMKKSSSNQLISADTAVENVHFSLQYMTLEEVGYRTTVTNISDIAAMGGFPTGVLVQVVVPFSSNQQEVLQLYKGITAATKHWGISLVGGDITRGSQWVIAITILGTVVTRPLLRSSAQLWDTVWVSGSPGLSALGLQKLQLYGRTTEHDPSLIAHIAPTPRTELGFELQKDSHVHACIDISDGVSKEALTIAFASNVGMELFLPDEIAKYLYALGAPMGSAKDLFLHGGDDYELLFTSHASYVPPAEFNCTPIGMCVHASQGVTLRTPDGKMPLTSAAWDHFS